MNGHFENGGAVWLQESGLNKDVMLRFERYVDGTYYHSETPIKVRALLTTLMEFRTRVRLYQGNLETGIDWLEENDASGYIGRSMGPLKVPLLLPMKRSSGGGAILDHCIIRMLIEGREVWRAPNYQEPVFEEHLGILEGHHFEVCANGGCHARFSTDKKRRRWLDFMTGKRMTK